MYPVKEPSQMYPDIYIKQPLELINDIPVFSETDFYVKNYEKISKDHLKYFEATGHNPFIREDHWKHIETSTEKLIQKYVNSFDKSQKVKVLDVGVGMGRLLEKFPALDRYGMDISLNYLEYAKRKSIEVCMSKIEDMPYHLNTFDLVITTDVLEHVLDLNLAISKILDVLKVNGILIIRVPYKEDLSLYLQKNFPYDLVHLRTFDEWSLRLLCEKIFLLHTLEFSLTGHINSPLKFIPPIPKVRGLIRNIIGITKILGQDIHWKVSEVLNRPSEINYVVKKVKSN